MSPALVPLADGVAYLPGSTNLGVVARPDGDALLVDAGPDRDAARAALRALQATGLRPRAALATHAHADHSGGSAELARSGLSIWAPAFERAVVEHPELEPISLFCGARPPAALRTKWLLAKPAPVAGTLQAGPWQAGGLAVEVVALPGHTPGQVGVAGGGVLFCADALFGPAVLEKHRSPFTHDVAAHRATLAWLRTAPYRCFVPAHGEPVEDVGPLVEANLAALDRTTAATLEALAEPADSATVVARVAERLGFAAAGLPQHFLFQSLVHAHLGHLLERGEALAEPAGGRLLWRRA